LLDGNKKVVHANRLGESQARAGDAVRVVGHRLLPTDTGASVHFARAISDHADVGDGEISNVHSIAMPSGRAKGLIATVLPVWDGERSHLLSPWSARWAVFVQEPGITPQIPGEAFARLYGLTGGELRTMLAVAPGLGVSEAAELLGMSEGTVRSHL